MVSAAEMLQFLQRRAQLQAHRLPPPGEFPAGWQGWFASMCERVGAVTGATADAIIELLSQRPLAEPPAQSAALTRWKAFASLWQQEWQPRTQDDRRAHLIATVITAVWHLLFGAMLLWLMYLQYLVPPAVSAGEDVVQVEYIGAGTPREVGGGAARPDPAAHARSPSASPSAAGEPQPAGVPMPASAVAADIPAPELALPAPEIPQVDVPEQRAPAPMVEQPVAVSEPVRAEEPPVFELPPPQPRIAERTLQPPELRAPAREVQVADVPEPVQPIAPRELPQRPIEARPLAVRTPTIAEREIPAPLPRVVLPDVRPPVLAQPQLSTETRRVEAREIPAPTPRVVQAPAGTPTAPPATARAATSAPIAASAATPAGSTTGRSAAAPSAPSQPGVAPPGERPSSAATPAAGAGPRAVAAPGAWPSPNRGDDWGDSTRERPGAQRGERPGLYNSDGSVRLGEPPGSASPGQPPGTVTQEIADLDRAGTWLKRKPTDYEPTALDRYWRPNETLLQEWVRRSIKTVLIPIPGTSKSIKCSVALLALGGGCDISDPNLNEQPAVARPPPEIPFKPHLQENNGSVRPGG